MVSAPFEWAHAGLPGLPKLLYLAAFLLPGGLIALPLAWWLDRGRRRSGARR